MIYGQFKAEYSLNVPFIFQVFNWWQTSEHVTVMGGGTHTDTVKHVTAMTEVWLLSKGF